MNPDAPIVLTLSPVPLNATFRGISCVAADCVSKSTLRVALDGVVGRGLENVYYWPSFEIVRWVGGHVPWPAYGFNRGDSRHVTRYLVAQIIDAFVEAFYTPAAVADDAGERRRGDDLRALTALVPRARPRPQARARARNPATVQTVAGSCVTYTVFQSE